MMTGRRTASSWEKQTFYNLSNGAKVTIEYGFYGDMITAIEFEGKRWHCSNGNADLPEFARAWVERVGPDYVVKPRFQKFA